MEEFWSNNYRILFDFKKIKEFYPKENMSLERKLNSIVRLIFYISIFLIVYKRNFNYLYFFILFLIIKFLIYKNKENEYDNFYVNDEQEIVNQFVKPTKNNPFMNISLDDYKKNPNRESISKKKNVNKQIESKFNIDLYKDFSDVFEKHNSQRQFYTTPITTIPNKQKDFANWLYNTPKSCKENNGKQCYKNIYNPLYDPIEHNSVFY